MRIEPGSCGANHHNVLAGMEELRCVIGHARRAIARKAHCLRFHEVACFDGVGTWCLGSAGVRQRIRSARGAGLDG
jgi:hypothetical protein